MNFDLKAFAKKFFNISAETEEEVQAALGKLKPEDFKSEAVDFDALKPKIEALITGKIDGIEKSVDNTEKITALEGNLADLTAAVTALTEKIEQGSQAAEEEGERTNELETAITALAAKIEGVNTSQSGAGEKAKENAVLALLKKAAESGEEVIEAKGADEAIDELLNG